MSDWYNAVVIDDAVRKNYHAQDASIRGSGTVSAPGIIGLLSGRTGGVLHN
jgi:hypothetical protein